MYILTEAEKVFVPSEGFSPSGYPMEIVVPSKLRRVRIRISSRTSRSLSLIMSFDVTSDKVGKLFCDHSFYCGTVSRPGALTVYLLLGLGLIIRDPDSIRDQLRIRSENRISGVPGSESG